MSFCVRLYARMFPFLASIISSFWGYFRPSSAFVYLYFIILYSPMCGAYSFSISLLFPNFVIVFLSGILCFVDFSYIMSFPISYPPTPRVGFYPNWPFSYRAFPSLCPMRSFPVIFIIPHLTSCIIINYSAVLMFSFYLSLLPYYILGAYISLFRHPYMLLVLLPACYPMLFLLYLILFLQFPFLLLPYACFRRAFHPHSNLISFTSPFSALICSVSVGLVVASV